MGFDFNFIISVLPDLLHGLLVTLEVGLISLVLALIIGIVGATIVSLKIPVMYQIITIYVEIFRNTPILVQIFFIYFGLPSIGIVLSELATGVLEFSLWGGAFAIDNFSGGFNAVPKQLKDAGEALGMTKLQVYRHIVIPIGFRTSFPSFGNTALSIIKCTNYLAGVGLFELTKTSMQYVTRNFKAAEMFISMAVMYLAVVSIMTAIFNDIERHMKHQTRRDKKCIQ